MLLHTSPEIGFLLIDAGYLHLPPPPLQFSSHSPLKLISLSSSLDHPNYTLISFPLSDCSLFRSHTAILNKCPVKFDFYLTLRV